MTAPRPRAEQAPLPGARSVSEQVHDLVVVPDPFELIERRTRVAERWSTLLNGARLADNECAHGRLPFDCTPRCGCWPEEDPPEPPSNVVQLAPRQRRTTARSTVAEDGLQHFHCAECDSEWTREPTRGAPPKRCPTCRGVEAA